MKLKLFLIIILPVITLSSCSCSTYRATKVKSLDVYNIDLFDNSSLSNCLTNRVKARFNKNQEYVPYLTLKQYASLYESHFDDNVASDVSKKGSIVTWTVAIDNVLYFHTQIDFKKKEVLTAGSLDSAFKPSDDTRDAASLYYGNKTEYDSVLLGDSYYAHYSFANQNIDYFSYLGDYYLPLSFYDITYCFDTNIYFYYNYKAIYSTRNLESFYNLDIGKSRSKCVVSEMIAYKNDDTIPDYLLDLNNNLFFYLLDNFYGLKQYKSIETAEEYCKNIGTYKYLYSKDDTTRTQAYAETLDRLDDNHTALVANSFVWGSTSYNARQYGQGCISRTNLNSSLNSLRAQKTTAQYRNERAYMISDDGKTGMFLFDEFKFGTTDEVFNKDGTIKYGARYSDSFYSLLAFFKELKNLGTVKNVVIDISTNGGGVLGVLMKVLALISKDNKGAIYYLEAASNQVGMAFTQVDSNNNGFFTADDCYGDDFNIYLLTSDCSFSCGNAFPCLAQKLGCAKVIGKKSGGGECAVAVHYLPNGEYVYHSSNLHLGYYDSDNTLFTGFENGAQPDISISNYSDFYDINYLSSIIQSH